MIAWLRPATALLVGVVVGAAAGCGGGGSAELPLPVSPGPQAPPASPVSELDPTDEAEVEGILAAFDDYMQVLIELSNAGVPGGTEESIARLNQTPVTGKAADDLMFDLLTENFMAGRATVGAPSWTAEVVGIDWEFSYPHNPDLVFPLATLSVCFDDSDWTTVEVESGEVVEGPGGRYLSTVTAEWADAEDSDGLIAESGWYINQRTDGTDPC